jgi:hypothetical protein
VNWFLSWRADPRARVVADRHYNRQKVGAPQFVPPGGCLVLATADYGALWVTSTPKAEYVQHAWAGAWVNSLFRNEASGVLSSKLITEAVSASMAALGAPPEPRWAPTETLPAGVQGPLRHRFLAGGIVSFVDASKVRRKRDPDRCYKRAGWHHVGFTKGGLWVFQQLPADMPRPREPIERQATLRSGHHLTGRNQ